MRNSQVLGKGGLVRDLIGLRKSENCGENINCDDKILLYFSRKST